jgi:hypothetical protein
VPHSGGGDGLHLADRPELPPLSPFGDFPVRFPCEQGNLQGIRQLPLDFGQNSPWFSAQYQWLSRDFPKWLNREFFRGIRDLVGDNREFSAGDREVSERRDPGALIGPKRPVPRLDEAIGGQDWGLATINN